MAHGLHLGAAVRFFFFMALVICGCEKPEGASSRCTVTNHGHGSKVITCEDQGPHGGMCHFSGTVTNSMTGTAIRGAHITLEPTAVALVTGADGSYTGMAPVGSYGVTFAASHFASIPDTLSLRAGVAVTKNVALMQNSEVIVSASASVERAHPAGSLTLDATIENLGSAMAATYAWTQTGGPAATITSASSASTGVTLADVDAYQAAAAPGVATFQVVVTMNDGKTYSGDVSVGVDLP